LLNVFEQIATFWEIKKKKGMAVLTILSTRNPVHKEKGYLMDEENCVTTL